MYEFRHATLLLFYFLNIILFLLSAFFTYMHKFGLKIKINTNLREKSLSTTIMNYNARKHCVPQGTEVIRVNGIIN